MVSHPRSSIQSSFSCTNGFRYSIAGHGFIHWVYHTSGRSGLFIPVDLLLNMSSAEHDRCPQMDNLDQPHTLRVRQFRCLCHLVKFNNIFRFESILTNEFHTLKGTCSTLVPSGVGYENVSLQNQVCTTLGSVAGQSIVDGATYAELSYGYTYSHTWRVCVYAVPLNFAHDPYRISVLFWLFASHSLPRCWR